MIGAIVAVSMISASVVFNRVNDDPNTVGS